MLRIYACNIKCFRIEVQRLRFAKGSNLIFFICKLFLRLFSKSVWFSWSSWTLRNEWAKIAILSMLFTDACLLKLVEIQEQTSLLRYFSHWYWCLFPKTRWNWSANKLKLQHLKMFVYFDAYLQLKYVASKPISHFCLGFRWGSKFRFNKNVIEESL